MNTSTLTEPTPEAANAVHKMREETPGSHTEPRMEVFGGTLPDGRIFEAIYSPERTPSLHFALAAPGGQAAIEESASVGSKTLYPPQALLRRIERGSILLASEATDYGDTAKLLEEIKVYIHKYIDLPSYEIALIAHYAMMTWVWDAFNAFPYLRFKGEPETGKTRCLEVLKQLSFRSIDLGVGSSKSAIFRFIDKIGGTALLDESDYDADLRSDLIKLLNAGYRKDGTTSLSTVKGDDWDPEMFNVGGPKVLANRLDFKDRALETRCLTIHTQSKKLAAHIPAELPVEFFRSGQEIRNQLLRWRMDTLQSINKSERELQHLDGRVRQLALPIYSISPDANFKKEFLKMLRWRSSDLREQDPSHIILEAILSLWRNGKNNAIPLQAVTSKAMELARPREVSEYEFKPKRTAQLVRNLRFKTKRRGKGYVMFMDKRILNEQCEHLGIHRSDARDERNVLVAKGVARA